MKEQIVKALVESGPRDKSRIIEFLERTDFYRAPAARTHHFNFPGGLARHSWNVFVVMAKKNIAHELGLSMETVAVTSLCHDLCKVGVYHRDLDPITPKQLTYLESLSGGVAYTDISKAHASQLIEWYKSGKSGDMPDEPAEEIKYKFEDPFPIGHGEKSALILSKIFEATEEELLMVRYHMGPFGCGDDMSKWSFEAAWKKYPGVVALSCADYEAMVYLETDRTPKP